MKLAIVGSRSLNEEQEICVENAIEAVVYMTHKDKSDIYENCQLVSGGAKGVDTVAKVMANWFKIKCIEFIPNWDKHGKAAGPIRNKLIVDECDKLVAFWDGKSKGTENSIDLAEKAGKLLAVFYLDNM